MSKIEKYPYINLDHVLFIEVNKFITKEDCPLMLRLGSSEEVTCKKCEEKPCLNLPWYILTFIFTTGSSLYINFKSLEEISDYLETIRFRN